MAQPIVVTLAREDAARVRDQERFNAALRRAASLGHESVMSPQDWRRDDDGRIHISYPALERIELVAGDQPPSDVAVLGVRMARAIGAIHGAGLVHGAIVTEALIHSADLGAQLGRFGLFSALCEGGMSVQDAALVLSDPAYVAPEVQNGKTPDERSDVFSLGASLYELLTGKPPYGGRTTSFVMASVLTSQDGASDHSNDAIAGPVIEALLRAIEHAPEDRWPTADAFAQALSLGVVTEKQTAESSKREGWVSAIFRAWFPARRSRG